MIYNCVIICNSRVMTFEFKWSRPRPMEPVWSTHRDRVGVEMGRTDQHWPWPPFSRTVKHASTPAYSYSQGGVLRTTHPIVLSMAKTDSHPNEDVYANILWKLSKYTSRKVGEKWNRIDFIVVLQNCSLSNVNSVHCWKGSRMSPNENWIINIYILHQHY